MTYRTALYCIEGNLVKTSLAFPVESPPRPQPVADLIALAAQSGSGDHTEGHILVWVDPATEPPARLEDAAPDAIRPFGPGTLPIPRYRWRHDQGSEITLIPLS